MSDHQAPAWAQNQTDTDLLLAMATKQEDPDTARSAREAFYLRHGRYLYAVCVRAYGDLLAGEIDDLVAETFRKAYEHADTFQDGGIEDPQQLARRTRAWLGRIAQRLMQDVLRGRSLVPSLRLEPGHWQNMARRCEPGGDPELIAKVRRALEQLTQREQHVLRATMQWYRPEKENQRMPDEAIEELSRGLDTTAENLRQIRSRAMRKLRELLAQPEQSSPRQGGESRSDYDWKTLFPTRRKRNARRRRPR